MDSQAVNKDHQPRTRAGGGRATAGGFGYSRRVDLVLPALMVTVAVLLGWWLRFVQDDAFITFTYARSLAEGEGLRWFGEAVEGYSSFLWVLWIALGFAVGMGPVGWAWTGGLLSLGATVWCLWRWGRPLLGSSAHSVVAVAFCLVNFSFLSYATGGLETMLQTALVTAGSLAALRAMREQRSPRRLTLLSLLVGAGLLVRLDSIALLAVPVGALALDLVRRRGWARLLALTLPAVLMVATWELWRLWYYGDVLPNTFYAKTGLDWGMILNGALYVARFFHWYLLWPLLAAGVVVLVIRRRSVPVPVQQSAAAVAVWLSYVIAVGGDFMEFRFLVPAIPLLALLVAYVILDLLDPLTLRRPAVTAGAVLAVLALVSVRHAIGFTGQTDDGTLDSIHALKTYYGMYPDHNWSSVGEPLGRELAGTRAVIAVAGVGAIPFYSRIPTVDMHGLTDRWIARNGVRPGPDYRRPGHLRRPTLGYLLKRGVNLVIASPRLLPRGTLRENAAQGIWLPWLLSSVPERDAFAEEIRLVSIPVSDTEGLLAWFVQPFPVLPTHVLRWERTTVRLSAVSDSAQPAPGHPDGGGQ